MTTQTHSGSPCSPAFGRRGWFVGSGHRSDLVDDAPGSSTEGQVVERYLYDPYERVTFLKPDWSLQEVTGHADGTASAFGNEILFTGYRYSPETGYYQVRHREFNPLMGRWMQRDPLGYVDGGNLYAGYFVMWGGVDPMGLWVASLARTAQTSYKLYTGAKTAYDTGTLLGVWGAAPSVDIAPSRTGFPLVTPVKLETGNIAMYIYDYTTHHRVEWRADVLERRPGHDPRVLRNRKIFASGTRQVDLSTRVRIYQRRSFFHDNVTLLDRTMTYPFTNNITHGDTLTVAVGLPLEFGCNQMGGQVRPTLRADGRTYHGDWSRSCDIEIGIEITISARALFGRRVYEDRYWGADGHQYIGYFTSGSMDRDSSTYWALPPHDQPKQPEPQASMVIFRDRAVRSYRCLVP